MRITKESVLETNDEVEAKDLELINSFAKKTLKAEEVFTFSVLLCDNEVDRDYECFTSESLYELSKLFIGKTGIFDHQWKADAQVARIYNTEVITDKTERTSYGHPYSYLKGYVYMMRTSENEALISEINGGIKKEVSVGCSVGSKICSICGEDMDSLTCPHTKGKEYGGKVCYAKLTDPVDAYEWSFVAVPAQKKAGVIKKLGFSDKCETVKDYVAMSQNPQFEKEFSELEKYSMLGKKYLDNLRNETVRLAVASGSGFKKEFLLKTFATLGEEELLVFKDVFESRLNETFPLMFQLHGTEKKDEKFSGEEFLV